MEDWEYRCSKAFDLAIAIHERLITFIGYASARNQLEVYKALGLVTELEKVLIGEEPKNASSLGTSARRSERE